MSKYNQDEIFISAYQNLNENQEGKTYLNLSNDNYVLKSDAPILAEIYGNNTEQNLNFNGVYYNIGLSNKDDKPFIHEIGKFFATRTNDNTILVCDNPLFLSETVEIDENYDAIMLIKDNYMMNIHSGNLTSLYINTFDNETSDLQTFKDSFQNISYHHNLFLDIFDGENPGYIWETCYNTDKYFFLFGKTTNTKKIVKYCLIEDFIVDPSNLNVWISFDVDSAGLYPSVDFSLTTTFSFCENDFLHLGYYSHNQLFSIDLTIPINPFETIIRDFDEDFNRKIFAFKNTLNKKIFVNNFTSGSVVYEVENNVFTEVYRATETMSISYYESPHAFIFNSLNGQGLGNFFDKVMLNGSEYSLISDIGSTYNYSMADQTNLMESSKIMNYCASFKGNFYSIYGERYISTFNFVGDKNLFIIEKQLTETQTGQHQFYTELK